MITKNWVSLKVGLSTIVNKPLTNYNIDLESFSKHVKCNYIVYFPWIIRVELTAPLLTISRRESRNYPGCFRVHGRSSTSCEFALICRTLYYVVSVGVDETDVQSHSERIELIKTARSALDDIHLTDVPIVAGIGAPSTHESIELAIEAAAAGCDFAMVIPPGYYAGALVSNPDSLKQFFVDIAVASPIPVLVFTFVLWARLILRVE